MKLIRISLLVHMLVSSATTVAHAAEYEIGASLVSANVGVGEINDLTTIGVPSGGLGVLQPGLFVSIFVHERVAIEPQVGLLFVTENGDSIHLLHAAVQVDYFIGGKNQASPYLLGSAGIIDVSDEDENPASLSFGGGYRIPVGDRLSFRIDGRFTHSTKDGGNTVSFGVSIGGLFGQ